MWIMRYFQLLCCLGLVLTACKPAASQETITVTGVVSTAVSGTASISTIVPENPTDLPAGATPPPTTAPPTPTPIPTLPEGLGPSDLKYHILEQYPDLFFCDPDYYPVAREEEIDLAIKRFPELQSNPEEFHAILQHLGLAGRIDFSDDEKLLIYREHKRLAAVPFELFESGYRFQILVAKSEGEGDLISGWIDPQGDISVDRTEPAIAACPICLAEGTSIKTPDGQAGVETLRKGDVIWTLDRKGNRVSRPVLAVWKTRVPADHRVIHLVLVDGREIWVSPGHPTADGRLVGWLEPGNFLDGAPILSIEKVTYRSSYTYDLLPSGDTGAYWANGILLASTIKPLYETKLAVIRKR